MSGHRMETSFQGCSSHRSGGSVPVCRRRELRGGNRGSAHALHEQREEHLRVEPGRDGFVDVTLSCALVMRGRTYARRASQWKA